MRMATKISASSRKSVPFWGLGPLVVAAGLLAACAAVEVTPTPDIDGTVAAKVATAVADATADSGTDGNGSASGDTDQQTELLQQLQDTLEQLNDVFSQPIPVVVVQTVGGATPATPTLTPPTPTPSPGADTGEQPTNGGTGEPTPNPEAPSNGGAAAGNLQPFAPDGWSAPIVVHHEAGSTTNASLLFSTEDTLVSISMLNSGLDGIDGEFDIVHEEPIPGLAAGSSRTIENINLGRLDPGEHKIRLVIDANQEAPEFDEEDNFLETTFRWF